MDNGSTERTITAPTLNMLMDRIEAATPPGMVAVAKLMQRIDGGDWRVEVRFKRSTLG